MSITCVVAAVDGSPASLHALDWAADEAARRDVRLLLVYACLWERYELPEMDEGDAIEDLLIIFAATSAVELRDQVMWVPI